MLGDANRQTSECRESRSKKKNETRRRVSDTRVLGPNSVHTGVNRKAHTVSAGRFYCSTQFCSHFGALCSHLPKKNVNKENQQVDSTKTTALFSRSHFRLKILIELEIEVTIQSRDLFVTSLVTSVLSS